MNKTAPLHIVLTGRFAAAIDDLRPRLLHFDKSTMRGMTPDGPVRILSADCPDRLWGLKVASYEVHPTAEVCRGLAECVQILSYHVARGQA